MAKIVRYNGNLVPFASSAIGTERTIFGSVAQANDITSQYNASFLRGWGIVGPSDQPTLQDFNAVSYTHGQILSYLHQVGIPEYNAAQEYHLGSVTTVSGIIYVSRINTNVGNSPASSPSQWAAQTQHGQIQFTGNGSFTVPAGVTTIYVSGCAGGGGGGGTSSTTSASVGGAGGGGAGQSILRVPYSVTPGQVIAISIGAGGTAGPANTAGGAGGDTTIGSLVTLGRGFGGGPGTVSTTAAQGGVGGNGFPAGAAGGDASNNSNGGGYGGPGSGGLFGHGGRIQKGTGGNAAIGNAAPAYGGGGSGAGGINFNVSGIGTIGGAGSSGIAIIEW